MTRIKLRYLDRHVDVTGKIRHYFRRSRRAKRIALPGQPGDPEFMAAYNAAALDSETPRTIKARGEPGTFDRLTQGYFSSTEFLSLAPSTQAAYRRVIDRWVHDEKIGHRRVDQMRREHVSKMIAKRASTPAAANDLLKKISILVQFAIDNGWRTDDPTLRIKKFANGDGHHTWTEEEIAIFERHWPAGSRERMAFALLVHTGQRLSDVVRMSWRDISDDGCITVRQQKTKEQLDVPILPGLKILLDAWPKDQMLLLVDRRGKPFTAAAFGKWMADNIAEAKLPDRCVTHGLRKAAARRMAEAGCSARRIMAWTGHKSLAEIERYTQAAEQKSLAKEAAKQMTAQSENKESLKGSTG
jgi:integrase